MARTRCRAPGRTTPTRATSRTQSGSRFLTQGGLKMTSSGYLQTLTTAFIGCLAAVGSLGAGEPLTGNPYAPAYDHAYRHGAVPTREALQRMRAWEAARRAAGPLDLLGLNTLSYGGGIDGIGVTSGTPKVYLVFYGSQWTGGGDPNGAATYLQNLFRGIGTAGRHDLQPEQHAARGLPQQRRPGGSVVRHGGPVARQCHRRATGAGGHPWRGPLRQHHTGSQPLRAIRIGVADGDPS